MGTGGQADGTQISGLGCDMVTAPLPYLGRVTTEQISGVSIRIAKGRTANGIPVLLTSPWPESIYAFRDLWPRLEKVVPLIAVDLPGFGLSESTQEQLSPRGMSEFIIELAAHLGITRLHAVGPDVGTPALLLAAARKPELFESIVGGSGATDVTLAGDGLRSLIASPPGQMAALEGGELAVQFVQQSAAKATPPGVMEDYRQGSAGPRFDQATGFVRAYATDLPLLQAALPKITTPVLVIAGRDDPIVPPANGQLLADHLPHCRYELLEGGHLVWEDAAQAYGDLLEAWLDGGYLEV